MGEEGYSRSAIEVLRWATRTRFDIKTKLDLLNAQLKAVNETTRTAMREANLLQWKDDIGIITLKQGGDVTTLKKEKLIYAMLQRGIPAGEVDEIIKAGSETKARADSVEFRADAED